MQNKLFLKAADICELLEVKQTSAYEIIGNLNKELEEQRYLTFRGKVPTKYFVKRLYGEEDSFVLYQLGVNPPADIASGRIAEVRRRSMSCNCMTRTSQQECRGILEWKDGRGFRPVK